MEDRTYISTYIKVTKDIFTKDLTCSAIKIYLVLLYLAFIKRNHEYTLDNKLLNYYSGIDESHIGTYIKELVIKNMIESTMLYIKDDNCMPRPIRQVKIPVINKKYIKLETDLIRDSILKELGKPSILLYLYYRDIYNFVFKNNIGWMNVNHSSIDKVIKVGIKKIRVYDKILKQHNLIDKFTKKMKNKYKNLNTENKYSPNRNKIRLMYIFIEKTKKKNLTYSCT